MRPARKDAKPMTASFYAIVDRDGTFWRGFASGNVTLYHYKESAADDAKYFHGLKVVPVDIIKKRRVASTPAVTDSRGRAITKIIKGER